MKELTICMTYHNRKFQLLNTLTSIQRQNIKTELFDIVIVDDTSDEPLHLNDFIDYNLDIKLISIQTNNKWWFNPCIAFNAAFNFVHGKRVIIQNSECLHKTDIASYVIDNLKENEYVAMSTLNLSKDATLNITPETNPNDIDTSNSDWYCHSVHLPRPFNFCAAMYSDKLKAIGGFDNRFAEGFFYDDDYFVFNLQKHNLSIRIEDSQVAYHQWHHSIWVPHPNFNELRDRNQKLLHNIMRG